MRRGMIAAGLSVAALLGGCQFGDGAGGNGPSAVGVVVAPGPTLSGAVAEGLMSHAVVTAYRWQAGGYAAVGSAVTDDAGRYSLSLPRTATGLLRLDVGLSADPANPTRMRCVAAHCGTAAFGEWFPLTANPGLTGWANVSTTAASTLMPVTPLSTLIVRYAEMLGGGHLRAAELNVAVQRAALLLGVPSPAFALTPGDVSDRTFVTTAAPAALKMSLLAAAFAQLADTQGLGLGAVIDQYAGAFLKNNGRLLQADAGVPAQPNLAALIQAAQAVNTQAFGAGDADWQAWLAQQQAGVLNVLPAAAPFNSAALITALGPMGQDIQSVMNDSSASTLQQLAGNELNQFRWLAASDTVSLSIVAADTVGYAILGSVMLANLPSGMAGMTIPISTGPLAVSLDTANRTLTVAGTDQGMNINLTLTLTALNAGSHAKPFVFGATGSVSNANISAAINGTLTIDPSTTNLAPLISSVRSIFAGSPTAAQDVLNAVADILRTGRGLFTINGDAGVQSLLNPGSTLAVTGKATLNVNMAGGTAGAILASGSVAYGTLTLPNGDRYTVDPAAGDLLTFGLAKNNDGVFNARFSAYALTLPQTTVMARGSLSTLGSLLTNVRNTVAGQMSLGQLNLDQVVSTVTGFDYSGMKLTVSGQANILGSYNHRYTLNLSGGSLKISQPNSTATAIEVTGGLNGMMVHAGTLTYLLGLDLTDLANPALLVGDTTTGGLTRLDFASL